ncbi:hypothetical protein BJY16_008327 [Actinoplanes octamycinicus]|uniref:Macro domain-containing protein n=1 Tax=Actinoplanes octamycinicus TaxID=135948 RepID=A0A7W7H6G1_9ACTN|nr:Appr-1-p processing protein [Actinoplanes octamycinicus]MBB4744868.1 hypothetical protein [Actinoplanes octamycinicus]GIE55454.1 Appr-1-p processing protein [Actinoplanes octamycinicus]
MRTLSFAEGDATTPRGDGPRIIAHVCNDIGAWGLGFVRAVSRRWPEPEHEFRRWHATRADAPPARDSPLRPGAGQSVPAVRPEPPFRLGEVQLVPVAPDLWVANMVGQHGIMTKRGLRTDAGYDRAAGPPVRYPAIRECLTTLTAHASALGASVHMPRIGCGVAGGTWGEVEPLIRATLCAGGVRTTVYDLPGPPRQHKIAAIGGRLAETRPLSPG